MHRFFSPLLDLRADTVTITDAAEIHHLKDVLRLKTGDTICLFDGKGAQAQGPILRCSPGGVEVRLALRQIVEPGGNGMDIILACAIPKHAKFEDIIEKTTELGVSAIIPVVTRRTEVRPDDQRAARKTSRYHLKAVSAAKQCQRASIPVIHPVTRFAELLKTLRPDDLAIIPCLVGERRLLREALVPGKNYRRVIFIIGPEGDFTPDEVKSALAAGCVAVSLGPTVLKVDTAAISVVAFGNFMRSA